jgi:hypothetical protein
VTLIVRFANGAEILEEFIVPSTSLPSITPEGSVEFKSVTSSWPFSVESPLYKNAPVTLSKDVTFIWYLIPLSLPTTRALPYDSLKIGGTSDSPTKSVLKLICAKAKLPIKTKVQIVIVTPTASKYLELFMVIVY